MVACKKCCRADGKPCSDLALVPDVPHGVSAAVGDAGATLTTTGIDGSTYAFTVPAGALPSEQTITMTPLSGVANLPLSGGLVAGAQFAPDGLAFLKPATLVVTLPAVVPPAGLVGFGFRRAGEGLHLTLATEQGRELTFAVTHFSGVGAARGTLDDIAALVGLLSPNVGAFLSSELAENLHTSEIAQLMAQGVRDPLVYQQVLDDWVNVSLRTTLATTVFETGVNQALLEYLGWKGTIDAVSRFLGIDFAATLSTEVEEMDRRMARALFTFGFGGAQARCFLAPQITSDVDAVTHAQLSAANDALEWFGILDGLGLAPLALGAPTLSTVLDQLCVAVQPFDARILPEDAGPGATAELRVRAGLTFRNPDRTTRAVVFASPLTVDVSATGVDAPIAGGQTDGTGNFRAAFRRDGTPPVTIAVRACIRGPEFPLLRAVCGAGDLSLGASTTTTTTTTTTLPASTGTVTFHVNQPGIMVGGGTFNVAITERPGNASTASASWSGATLSFDGQNPSFPPCHSDLVFGATIEQVAFVFLQAGHVSFRLRIFPEMPPAHAGQCGFGFERFHIDLDGRAFTPDLALFDGQVCAGPIQNQDRCFRSGQPGVDLGGGVQINHAP